MRELGIRRTYPGAVRVKCTWMSIRVRLRFDGEVLVPQEPVDLRIGEIVDAEFVSSVAEPVAGDWRAALARLSTRGPRNVAIPASALRRSAIYEDPR
jgi:hypothetical protein